MRLFLGIDGGQSSTTALIGDETGRVLGTGTAGPCNHAKSGEGRTRFVAAIEESVRAASAGLDGQLIFAAACLGLSGGPDDKDALAREFIRSEHYLITHDAHIALAGATGGGPGMIVIAGTGSIAYGRNSGGQTARAGGWGYLFGDEGGAFDIVRQATRAALRFEEGWGPKTRILDALLSKTGAHNANDLLHKFYTDEFPRHRIAELAPLIDEMSREGDPIAAEILGSAAQNLASIAGAVRRQLFKDRAEVDVRYSGGVFGSAALLTRFQMLVELEDGNRVSAPKHNPAEGALLEAYRIGGIAGVSISR